VDKINRFQTKTTMALARAEYGVALGVCLVAFLRHIGEVRWMPAVILFTYIDLIGYLPGHMAHLLSRKREIRRTYYVLYNIMHSFVTQAAVVGLWLWVFRFEWALLVVPIHLCGDRAIFGNFVKSFKVPFEPKPLPAFSEFERRLRGEEPSRTFASDRGDAAWYRTLRQGAA
jgi:hypothetical protein